MKPPGKPLQAPVEAVSVWPFAAVPETDGTAVFRGTPVTTVVGLEVAVTEPLAFVAATTTRNDPPTSPTATR